MLLINCFGDSLIILGKNKEMKNWPIQLVLVVISIQKLQAQLVANISACVTTNQFLNINSMACESCPQNMEPNLDGRSCKCKADSAYATNIYQISALGCTQCPVSWFVRAHSHNLSQDSPHLPILLDVWAAQGLSPPTKAVFAQQARHLSTSTLTEATRTRWSASNAQPSPLLRIICVKGFLKGTCRVMMGS